MKMISVFNNKGGVGKSTLTFHIGYALSALGKKVLMIDLDPQCNLTICSMDTEKLHEIWAEEDEYIEDFDQAFKKSQKPLDTPRTIHFLLKPTEDGISNFAKLPPTIKLNSNLDLIPGRLSVHKYENKIAERWSGAYQGDTLAIRTITRIREICNLYAEKNDYDFVIIDTSPSLGILNKTIISTVDGFFVPAQPDMFSLYGIRNIGNSLDTWKKEFETIYNLISSEKRKKFPKNFVQFLGFTIYNAKKYSSGNNKYDLADAHFKYAEEIPKVIKEFIKKPNRISLSDQLLSEPIGDKAIIHSHNTFPSVAQSLKCPMWEVPDKCAKLGSKTLTEMNIEVNRGSYGYYKKTKENYTVFVQDLLKRIHNLDSFGSQNGSNLDGEH